MRLTMRHYRDPYLSMRPAFLPAACLPYDGFAPESGKVRRKPTGGHMDVLSEVLKVVRLQGAMFYNGEFSSPWSFCSPPSHMVAPYVAPAAGHVIIYHLRGDWSTPKTSASAATIGVAPQVIARINRLSWQRKDSRSQGSW